jgi:hypothetical protein
MPKMKPTVSLGLMSDEKELTRSSGLFELSLDGYEIRSGAIDHGPQGTVFSCSIGPLAAETLAALEDAQVRRCRIVLLLPEPLLLDGVALAREAPQRIRIVGRIVGPAQ